MTSGNGDWDLLICGSDQEIEDYNRWFPAGKIRGCKDLAPLEGMRPRNAYVTSLAIENGSSNLFFHLYYNARCTGGKVLHVSDYREYQ